MCSYVYGILIIIRTVLTLVSVHKFSASYKAWFTHHVHFGVSYIITSEMCTTKTKFSFCDQSKSNEVVLIQNQEHQNSSISLTVNGSMVAENLKAVILY